MSNEMEAKELGVAQHIRNAAPDGCMCEPCIAAREAFGVETSKPADLQRAQEFLRNHGNSWLCDAADLFVAFAKEVEAAHISEVERVTKERDESKLAFKSEWERNETLETKLEAAESKLSQLQLELRKMYWLGHGHVGQYGDDGEMQCPLCMQEGFKWDYKRADFGELAQQYQELRFKHAAAQKLANEEKARKIEKMFNNAADDFHQRDWHDEILAILNGGQS